MLQQLPLELQVHVCSFLDAPSALALAQTDTRLGFLPHRIAMGELATREGRSGRAISFSLVAALSDARRILVPSSNVCDTSWHVQQNHGIRIDHLDNTTTKRCACSPG